MTPASWGDPVPSQSCMVYMRNAHQPFPGCSYSSISLIELRASEEEKGLGTNDHEEIHFFSS